jgi:hypothetical protein
MFCTSIHKRKVAFTKGLSLEFTKEEMSSHQSLLLFPLVCVALPFLGAFLFLVAAFPSLVAVVRGSGLGTRSFELMK